MQTASNDFADRMGIDKDLYFLSWSIVNRKGHYNYPHKHGCTISGCYYVDTGGHPTSEHPSSGVTPFFKDREKIPREGIDDIEKYAAIPQAGTMVTFPGDLLHMVLPYEGEEERIIVGFDLFIDAYQQQNFKRLPLEAYL